MEKREKLTRESFGVSGMDCATCAMAIEKQVKKVEGVKKVGASVMLNRVYVDYDETKADVAAIMSAIRKTGYGRHRTRVEKE